MIYGDLGYSYHFRNQHLGGRSSYFIESYNLLTFLIVLRCSFLSLSFLCLLAKVYVAVEFYTGYLKDYQIKHFKSFFEPYLNHCYSKIIVGTKILSPFSNFRKQIAGKGCDTIRFPSMNSRKRGAEFWQFVILILLPLLLLFSFPKGEGASVAVRSASSGISGIAVVDMDEMIRNLQCFSGPCGATSFRCPTERCSYHYTFCSKAKRQTVCCC